MMTKEVNVTLDKSNEHVFIKTFVAGGKYSIFVPATECAPIQNKLRFLI